MDRTGVLVGVDGSPSSWQALRWAADEAERRHVPLRLLAAYRPPWLIEEIPAGADLDEAARDRAGQAVADMVGHAREAAPGARITGTAVAGPAGPVLVTAAADAALVVVGCRGQGGFDGLRLGATALQVAAHAPASVVVVRGRPDPVSGPVVVGTDLSPGAETAVATAFESAALYRCAVEVRRACPAPRATLFPWTGTDPPAGMADRQRRAVAHAALADTVTAWRWKYPAVPVDTVVVAGEPAGALVEASRAARLLIVGAHGAGTLPGRPLGSVAQQLLHHAACPVLVARPEPAGYHPDPTGYDAFR